MFLRCNLPNQNSIWCSVPISRAQNPSVGAGSVCDHRMEMRSWSSAADIKTILVTICILCWEPRDIIWTVLVSAPSFTLWCRSLVFVPSGELHLWRWYSRGLNDPSPQGIGLALELLHTVSTFSLQDDFIVNWNCWNPESDNNFPSGSSWTDKKTKAVCCWCPVRLSGSSLPVKEIIVNWKQFSPHMYRHVWPTWRLVKVS